MCIALAGDNWSVLRSVEVLGYDTRGERNVRVLMTLLAESQVNGNALSIMHRGNVRAYLRDAWPAARHEAEADELEDAVLHQIYARAFDCDGPGGSPRLVCSLTPMDRFVELDNPVPVHAHSRATLAGCLDDEESARLRLAFGDPEHSGYVPFTQWDLDGFDRGVHLISFDMVIEGETYERLVGDSMGFSVSGPLRLLDAVRFNDIPSTSADQRPGWRERLKPFDTALGAEGYDVIVLQEPCRVSAVVESVGFSRRGISRAPTQPSRGAVRYVTGHAEFDLPLEFTATSRLHQHYVEAPREVWLG